MWERDFPLAVPHLNAAGEVLEVHHAVLGVSMFPPILDQLPAPIDDLHHQPEVSSLIGSHLQQLGPGRSPRGSFPRRGRGVFNRQVVQLARGTVTRRHTLDPSPVLRFFIPDENVDGHVVGHTVLDKFQPSLFLTRRQKASDLGDMHLHRLRKWDIDLGSARGDGLRFRRDQASDGPGEEGLGGAAAPRSFALKLHKAPFLPILALGLSPQPGCVLLLPRHARASLGL
mmetsp:Transcript_7832/g.17999  ORF Transcript_7832/g.17999 Transcript_7832/m.17999 type:complete len:228 (-) Transcript_7832:1934-2617(-)